MTRPVIFISYSQEDEKEKDELLSHLGLLKTRVELWSIDQIRAGADFEAEISRAIAQAKIAILLITAGFLTSEFILIKEIPAILERRNHEGLIVFPVIAKACAWKTVDWLNKMKVRPKNGRPIWSNNRKSVNESLTVIVEEVALIVESQRGEGGPLPRVEPVDIHDKSQPQPVEEISKASYNFSGIYGKSQGGITLNDLTMQLRTFDGQHADYMLWLGAGASVSSGVPTASGIVLDLLRQKYAHYTSARLEDVENVSEKELREWTRINLPWFNPDDRNKSEYAQVMDNVFLAPGLREKYLRQLLQASQPSEGYKDLGLLIKRGIFDTVITTNFDHLVRQGADPVLAQPMIEVYALNHFESLTVFSPQPRLIRLQGDFWHDNLLNIEVEPEKKPLIRFEAVKQLLREYGLIVIGYGGWDLTVMRNFFDPLKNDPRVFKKGIFWCHRKGSPLSPLVEAFLRLAPADRAFLVEIESFDQVMKQFAASFELTKTQISNKFPQPDGEQLQQGLQRDNLSQLKTSTDFDQTLTYELKAQPWYAPEIPQVAERSLERLGKIKNEIDIVIITATEVELKAVLHLLNPFSGRKQIFLVYGGPETYYLGKFGAHNAVVTKCRMGSIGEGSVILATESAQRLWRPKAIIMTGIAFGKDSGKQKLGDVLIASQIISYEQQRVGPDGIIQRGSIPPSNTTLLNRFENIQNWNFPRPDGQSCTIHVGPILSGEKLIDNPEFKAALFKQFPQAIGGEMEGAGLVAASGRVGTAWILVKAICDWGDGQKHKQHQPLAAAAAASLVHHVLIQKTILNTIKKT